MLSTNTFSLQSFPVSQFYLVNVKSTRCPTPYAALTSTRVKWSPSNVAACHFCPLPSPDVLMTSSSFTDIDLQTCSSLHSYCMLWISHYKSTLETAAVTACADESASCRKCSPMRCVFVCGNPMTMLPSSMVSVAGHFSKEC